MCVHIYGDVMAHVRHGMPPLQFTIQYNTAVAFCGYVTLSRLELNVK